MTKTLCGPVSTFYRGNARKKVQIRYCIIWRCLHLMFSTTNVSDKWNVRGFERMLSYEQYPEEKSRLWLSSFKKQLINLHGGQLDVTTNIYLKSCAFHPDSERCTFFHGNLSDPKSSEDTLLYLYVIWNMSKSSDLHKTILTPVICHKHVRCHDGVTLYFSVKIPSVAPEKTTNRYFSYMSADFHFLE